METCKGCGIAFERRGRSRYCSRVCRQRVYEVLRTEKPAATFCLLCKQPIGVRLGGRRRQFCGDACRMAWWRTCHLTDTTIICDQCGKSVHRPPSGVTHAAKNHFCSPTCKGKWMTLNLLGANHPNWKGNSPEWMIQFIARRLHSDPRWQEWSQTVLANANGLCERCGNPAQEAHHKREVAELLALILDPANGEALCQDCHVGHHHP